MTRFEVVPLPSSRRVGPDDDLAAVLLAAASAAGVALTDGDVVCIASKVVSKAEGAYLDPPPGDAREARRAAARAEAVRVVADTPWVLVVETRHGFVCANAGIDSSNVADGRLLLLPDDPDTSAAALRRAVLERTGADVGVVVTDTFGRPWRLGQTDVALGAAGIVALRDDRGRPDMEGRALEVTMIAVADQLAAAADLARAKADGTPFVLVRGLDVDGQGRAADLVRPSSEDVFRHGGPTAVAAAVAGAAERTGRLPLLAPPDPAVLDRALEAALAVPVGPGVEVAAVEDAAGEPPDAPLRVAVIAREPAADFDLGAAVERVRLVVEAFGLATAVRRLADGRAVVLAGIAGT